MITSDDMQAMDKESDIDKDMDRDLERDDQALEPALPQGSEFHSPEVDPTGLVTITLFGRKYHIRSDKPDMIFQLAYLVQSAVNEIKGDKSDSELASLDTLVQATFKLALQLHNSLREEKTLRDTIESLDKRLGDLLDQIDRTLSGL
ncbi:MAG: cell division protein ZapA [Deltaproteobacteria bacterium]|jgi:cell division protein ZapA (FtsZ GTPase activity inhibitor)|nr:cell division protein ZapA [Deltaproteobacteria bacterium]